MLLQIFLQGNLHNARTFPLSVIDKERWTVLSVKTRMHSSRMRTGRSLTVCCSLLPGEVLLGPGGGFSLVGGGSPWSRGVLLGRRGVLPGPGGCLPGPGGF